MPDLSDFATLPTLCKGLWLPEDLHPGKGVLHQMRVCIWGELYPGVCHQVGLHPLGRGSALGLHPEGMADFSAYPNTKGYGQ